MVVDLSKTILHLRTSAYHSRISVDHIEWKYDKYVLWWRDTHKWELTRNPFMKLIFTFFIKYKTGNLSEIFTNTSITIITTMSKRIKTVQLKKKNYLCTDNYFLVNRNNHARTFGLIYIEWSSVAIVCMFWLR